MIPVAPGVYMRSSSPGRPLLRLATWVESALGMEPPEPPKQPSLAEQIRSFVRAQFAEARRIHRR